MSFLNLFARISCLLPMNTLLIKIIMMPIVIGGVTIASKKWGNLVGGMIASLPWIAGPIMFFFTFEQGVDFAVNSVKGIMMGIVGVLAFCFAYIYSAIKSKWYTSLVLAYCAFVATTVLLKTCDNLIGLEGWFLIAVILSLIGLFFFPNLEIQASSGHILKFDIYQNQCHLHIFHRLCLIHLYQKICDYSCRE